MTPTVSILIPSGGQRPRMLAETLASIEAQTYPKAHVQTLISISEFPYPRKIVDLARLARGEYVLPLCDDDTLRSDALFEFLAAAKKCNADLVYSEVQQFGEATARYVPQPFTLAALKTGPVAWFTSLIRRSAFLNCAERVDLDLPYNDWALRYELFKAGAVWAKVNAPLWNYRVHPGQHMRRLDLNAERARFFAAYPELAA